MKKCPFCGAEIEDSARFCLYCMQSLTEKEQILLHQKKKPQWLLIIAAIVAVCLVPVLLLFGRQSPTGSETPSGSSQPDSGPTINQTEPSDPSPVTEPPHVHSYCVENTAIEYQKEDATCTSPAIFYYACACGEKGSETFPYGETAEHTVVTEQGYPVSCETPGLTDGTYCSVCGTVFLTQTEIPLVNHTYDNEDDACCNVCNYVRARDCDHAETVTLSAISPTCTASGLTAGKKCAICEEVLITQTILAPLGHTEVIDPAVAATCTTAGKTQGKHCSTCNTVLVAQVTVAAKGHSEVIDPAVAATCTTAGKTEGKHCSVCQIVLVYQQNIPARGHSFDSANPLAPCSVCGAKPPHTHSYSEKNTADQYQKEKATCLAPAVYYYSCACGAKGTNTFSYGDLGEHDIVTDPGYPATCDTPGLSDGTHCTVCQRVFMTQSPLRELGHTFIPSDSLPACLVCGKKGTVIVRAQDFPFTKEGEYQITGCTYTIRPDSVEEKWDIYVYADYISLYPEATILGPNASLRWNEYGYSTGVQGVTQLSEPGICKLHFRVANSADAYELVFW